MAACSESGVHNDGLSREGTTMGRITRASVLVALTLLLAACETAEHKAQRLEAERQKQAQAQAQKAEAERAQQAAEAARALREELGDEIVVKVKHWAGAGENYATLQPGCALGINEHNLLE